MSAARPLQVIVNPDAEARPAAESAPLATGRISAEEAATLLKQLESGECTCLGPNAGTQLLREVLFLRRQVRKIHSLSDSQLTQSLAHDALYGARR